MSTTHDGTGPVDGVTRCCGRRMTELPDDDHITTDDTEADCGRVANPCGHRTRHTERISCCSGCREMFTSDSAWSRHRKALTCLLPANVGLVPKPSRTAPGETLWALPASDREWGQS